LEDFGTIGSMVFFLLFGWLDRVLFTRARAGNSAVIAPLTLVYAFVLTSPAVGMVFFEHVLRPLGQVA
jgi:hypothetical protein